MKKLSVGILGGAGVMGKRRAKIIKENFSDIAEVSCLWDVKEGYDRSFRNVDCAFICTPTQNHLEDFDQLSKHTKCFFVEKPIAFNFSEADSILSEASINGHMIKMGTNFLHIPVISGMRKLMLENAKDGKTLFSIRAKVGHNGTGWIEGWRSDRNRGTLLDNGIHIIDFISSIYGLPKKYSAKCYNIRKRNKAEDFAVCAMDYGSFVVSLQCSWVEEDGYASIEACYDGFTLLCDNKDSRSGLWLIKGKDAGEINCPDAGYSHMLDMKEFFDAIISGDEQYFQTRHYRYAKDMIIIDGLYMSDASSREVSTVSVVSSIGDRSIVNDLRRYS
jgi:predicted dehydrogenase